jgi:hypothetical protein
MKRKRNCENRNKSNRRNDNAASRGNGMEVGLVDESKSGRLFGCIN